MTSLKEPNTSSLVIITSVWSVPKKSATSFAYFKSIGSVSIPIANVLIGVSVIRWPIAHTNDESKPPDNK